MSDLTLFTAALASLFGLLIGSFLNVCIYRLPRRLSVVAPRSFCPECETQVRWHDNIPVLSFLFLGGRCRNCRARIPLRYPAVELMTAILFFAVVLKFSVTIQAVKWLVFACIMVVLMWTDLEARLLPDIFTLGGIVAGLVFSFFAPVGGLAGFFAPSLSQPVSSFINAVVATALLSLPFAGFASLYTRLRRITPPGQGDIKLLGTLGAFLGLGSGVMAMLIGSVTGVVLGFGYIVVKREDPKSALLPFGTFLAFGGLISVFWGAQILSSWMNFSR
jgi:leader peptidase (prepilin peptidase) / N-methyltransferase